MKYTFIGDVHGKYDRYKKIMSRCINSIQVGDMGVGFRRYIGHEIGSFFPNPPYDKMVEGNHKFIRGNHDNPGVCRNHSQWIPDGYTETTDLGNKIMFIGGAFSIDRDWRHEGYDWWADEELSQPELYSMMDLYMEFKPDIMVTHDCPSSVADNIFADDMRYGKFNSKTGSALASMFANHKPNKWIFGHWHKSKNEVIDGTNFICLAELETMKLDI
jgi:predicted phosphodiesterase